MTFQVKRLERKRNVSTEMLKHFPGPLEEQSNPCVFSSLYWTGCRIPMADSLV